MKSFRNFYWLFTLCAVVSAYPAHAQKSETTRWYVSGYTEDNIRSYLDENEFLDDLEGIWQSSDGFKYAIERDVEDGYRLPNQFRIVVLSSSHNGWRLGEVKGFITTGSVDGMYSMKYYTSDVNRGNLSSQEVLLFMKNSAMMSFTRIDTQEEIVLVKLYPKAEALPNMPAQELEQWSGSGIAIDDKHLATNYHVVEDAQILSISIPIINKQRNYEAEVVATDKFNDLAIVKIIDPAFPGFGTLPYGSKTSTAELGEEIFVLGYPLVQTMGDDVKLTTGVISSKTGFQGDISLYQISAPVQPGNSGGPLFDSRGNLIGIVSAKHQGAENVGFAIKLNYLKALTESMTEQITFPQNNVISPRSLSEKVKTISNYVVLVKANMPLGETPPETPATSGNHSATMSDKARASELYITALERIKEKDFHQALQDISESIHLYPTLQGHRLRFYIAREISNRDAMEESAKYCVEHGDEDVRIKYAIVLQLQAKMKKPLSRPAS